MRALWIPIVSLVGLAGLVACQDASAPGARPASGDASSPSSRRSVAADGRVHWRLAPGFDERARTRIEGERRADGSCGVTHTVSFKPGQSGGGQVVEHDPRTCEVVVAEGTWGKRAPTPGDSVPR